MGLIGGSKVTWALASMWRRTGGIEVKEAGVEPVSVRCSSGEMYDGTSVMGFTAGMLVRFFLVDQGNEEERVTCEDQGLGDKSFSLLGFTYDDHISN